MRHSVSCSVMLLWLQDISFVWHAHLCMTWCPKIRILEIFSGVGERQYHFAYECSHQEDSKSFSSIQGSYGGADLHCYIALPPGMLCHGYGASASLSVSVLLMQLFCHCYWYSFCYCCLASEGWVDLRPSVLLWRITNLPSSFPPRMFLKYSSTSVHNIFVLYADKCSEPVSYCI